MVAACSSSFPLKNALLLFRASAAVGGRRWLWPALVCVLTPADPPPPSAVGKVAERPARWPASHTRHDVILRKRQVTSVVK